MTSSSSSTSPFFGSFRFWVSLILAGARCWTWLTRVSLNVAVVCMVNSTCVDDKEKNCSDPDENAPDVPIYNWSSTTQGLLLSAAFAGFCIGLIPSGIINQKFGTKIPLAIALAVNGVLTAVIPLIAQYEYVLGVLRLGNGAITALMITSNVHAGAQWAPFQDKAKFMAVINTGELLGVVSAQLFVGLICTYIGWPYAFYIFGGVCFSWSALIIAFYNTTPGESRFIKLEEKAYIQESLGSNKNSAKQSRPPMRFLISPSFVALSVLLGCYFYIVISMNANYPTYFRQVFRFEIKTVGILCCIMTLVSTPTNFFGGWLADWCVAKRGWSVTYTRRLFAGVPMIIIAGLIVGHSFLGESNRIPAVAMVLLGSSIHGLAYSSSVMVNILDIAPRAVNFVFPIATTLSGVTQTLVPSIRGFLTPNGTREEWQRVLLLQASLLCLGALVFCTLGRGEEQEWAKPKIQVPQDEENDEEERNQIV